MKTNSKKLVAVILCVIMLAATMSTVASASEERTVIATHPYNENISWTLYSDGEIVYTGEGEMGEATERPERVIRENGYPYPTVITIGEGITDIAYDSFCDVFVNKLNIPSTVTHIDSMALYIPIKEINLSAENKNYKMVDGIIYSSDETVLVKYTMTKPERHFTIPETVTEIAPFAFCSVYMLNSVTIGENVKEMNSAFYLCSGLDKVEFLGEREEISPNAFSGCCSLDEVIFPKGLKTIGGAAFMECYSLDEIVIPEGVETIGPLAFKRCESASKVVIPSTCTSIDSETFDEVYSAEEFYILSENLTVEQLQLATEFRAAIPEKLKTAYEILYSDFLIETQFSRIFDGEITDEEYDAMQLEAINIYFGTSFKTTDEFMNSPEYKEHIERPELSEGPSIPSYLTVFGYPETAAKAFAEAEGLKYGCAHKWSEAICGETKICTYCAEEKVVVHEDADLNEICDICGENLAEEDEPQSNFIVQIFNTIVDLFNKIIEFFKNLFG